MVLDEATTNIPDALKSDSPARTDQTRSHRDASAPAAWPDCASAMRSHPDVADLMNRVRQPFNVNSISLAAAAAGLDDREFVRRMRAEPGMRQLTAV